MSDDLTYTGKSFLESEAQYLVVIVSCLPKKLDVKKEPILAAVVEKFRHADIYGDAKIKRTPGGYILVGDGKMKRQIILVCSQFYPSKSDYPNDNKSKRLNWFREALDQLGETPRLKSVCFADGIARDGGGNWSQYYSAILDWAQTIHLNAPHVVVEIGENPVEEGGGGGGLRKGGKDVGGGICTQVSLLNCRNLGDVVPLQNIRVAEVLSKNQPYPVKKFKYLDTDNDFLGMGGGGDDGGDNLGGGGGSLRLTGRMVDIKVKGRGGKKKKVEEELDEEDDEISEEAGGSRGGGSGSEGGSEVKEGSNMKKPLVVNRPKSKQIVVEDDKMGLDAGRVEHKKFQLNLTNLKKRTAELERSKVTGEDYFPKTRYNEDWVKPLSEVIFEQVDPSWVDFFKRDDLMLELEKIDGRLKESMEEMGDVARFLPSYDLIFNAFRLCSWDNMKVVILGQDPYFSNINEAMGLSFSVPKGVKIPSSLNNIFKELANNFEDYEKPNHGDLTEWAKQGVLLLNTALTVVHGKKGIHIDIWRNYTDTIIKMISDLADHPLIFMLWGKTHAGKKKVLINGKRHLILESTHPSGLSANRGGWFNQDQFATCHMKLDQLGLDPIDWRT